MKKSKFYILLVFIILNNNLFSQDTNYARYVIDTLSGKFMFGRGYTNDGLEKAANYISGEFKSIGLKPFNNSYYQELSYPINTFPEAIMLSCNKKQLKFGSDYIIAPFSSSLNGTFNTIYFNKKTVASPDRFNQFLQSDLRKKIVIIDDDGIKDDATRKTFKEMQFNPFHAAAVVYLDNNEFMWGASTDTAQFVSINAKRALIGKKCKEIDIHVKNSFIQNFKTKNVIGYIEGTVYPDSFLVFSAHYDHLGGIGNDVYYPGAHDNGSGVALMLDLAKYYSKPENKPNVSIVFIAFTGEEAGLIGSRYFVEHPLFKLKKTRFLLNLDIIGTGKDGIMVVNGSVFAKEFRLLEDINSKTKYVSSISTRGKAANSDHYFFSEENIPSFFIYTKGEPLPYHSINDINAKIPLKAYNGLFKLVVEFYKTM
ncbi:MAG: M28 family peptidase [Bacteroidota bacterium]